MEGGGGGGGGVVGKKESAESQGDQPNGILSPEFSNTNLSALTRSSDTLYQKYNVLY